MIVESKRAWEFHFSSQVFKALVASFIALAVDLGVLVSLTELLRLSYLASAIIAFCAGALANYFLSIKWVFTYRRYEDARIEIILFHLIGGIGLLLTTGLMYCGTTILLLDYRLSKLIIIGIVFAWNFGARRALLFQKKDIT